MVNQHTHPKKRREGQKGRHDKEEQEEKEEEEEEEEEEKKEGEEKGTWPETHAPRHWDNTPGQDVVNQHTQPEKRRGTEGETRQRRRRRRRRGRRRRRRRENRRRRERDVASNTRTLTLGHHPRSGRGKPAHAPQEGDEEGGEEEEKGAWPATHAP